MNWSKGDNRAKLEAALIKWKDEQLEENGEAFSRLAFAKMQEFRKGRSSKYAIEKLKVEASFGPGRKKLFRMDGRIFFTNVQRL